MSKKIVKFTEFYIIGICVRTTNELGQMGEDIPQLWKKFLEGNTQDKIPNKLEDTVYSVYTDYEGDFTQPYTVILGCKVKNLTLIPQGMVGKVIPGGEFMRFTAKGNLNEGVIYSKWVEIWKTDLNRKYTADFEVYEEKSQNPEKAEVDIFIAVRE